MNRYPLWKYLLILAAVIVGLVYTLPNFYGEVPAVQVSPLRSNLKVDAALMERVEEALKKADLTPEGVALDTTSVKARLSNTEDQLKAKDVVQAALGDDYVVALNLLSRSPEWLTSIGALPMYLGLDLRGGVHFLMQVDMKSALTKRLDAYGNDIRTLLRDQRIQYSGISRDGQALTVRFREAALRDRALARIAKDFPDLELKTAADAGEFRISAALRIEAQRQIQEFALQQNINTLRNRVNELGVAEPIIQQQGADRVVVQLPGVQDTAKAKDILGRTATLEVRMVDDEKMRDLAAVQQAKAGQVPFGTDLYYERNGEAVLVRKQVVLTGERINDAQPGFDGTTGEPAVHISLDGAGARIFQQVTRENVGKRMAILLFERGKGEVVTAPVIRTEIGGGRVQISGRMTTQEARDVSLLLRAGALAAPMEIVEERTVGPSLGADNIRIGFNSALYGFAAIAVFMIMYYTLVGVFSVLALAMNVLFLTALLSMLQATLTLPGMAGIALTIGMAIDANVLINERIREELRNGNTPHAAIYVGYDRAWGTILDSNITTLIAGLALFAFGSGPVKGFAVVLCLGILTSIFSAVMVSRSMMNLYYGSRRKLDHISIG
ncbi:MAG: protein translocase subunit SecD [Burkholderiales bacterium]|nr:protein translocase subunit SecD [Burkholderiales bacterium]MDP2397067.1 protein translocase subunit SecD [Burkholderiales bacterium]